MNPAHLRLKVSSYRVWACLFEAGRENCGGHPLLDILSMFRFEGKILLPRFRLVSPTQMFVSNCKAKSRNLIDLHTWKQLLLVGISWLVEWLHPTQRDKSRIDMGLHGNQCTLRFSGHCADLCRPLPLRTGKTLKPLRRCLGSHLLHFGTSQGLVFGGAFEDF